MTSRDPNAEVDHLRAEIVATRADLGETVEALAAKADVKARAQRAAGGVTERAGELVERVGQAGRSATDRATRAGRAALQNPRSWIIATISAMVAVAAIAMRRRRR